MYHKNSMIYFNLICSFPSMVSIDYCFTVADFFFRIRDYYCIDFNRMRVLVSPYLASVLANCLSYYMYVYLQLCVYHVLSCDSAAALQKQTTLTVCCWCRVHTMGLSDVCWDDHHAKPPSGFPSRLFTGSEYYFFSETMEQCCWHSPVLSNGPPT